MPCPSFTMIEYIEAEIEKLDFRDLISNDLIEEKLKIRDELLKSNLYLDYITTDRIITDTDGLIRASDEELINAKRSVLLNDIIF